MPKIGVNGVNIVYEVAGEGPPLVWTPPGWSRRNPFAYAFSGRFSANFKVLLWDRRNGNGASDIAVVDAQSNWHVWTDDLHAMLHELKMVPAYFGGGSAGCVTSLLMAHRYPDDVKALILNSPMTDQLARLEGILNGHYLHLANAAESGGMEAVIEASQATDAPFFARWVADSIGQNPDNREKVLAHDPQQFALIMNQWCNWEMGASRSSPIRLHLANLTDDEVRCIDKPALVLPGRDGPHGAHPEHTAKELYTLLPNSAWGDFATRYSEEEIQRVEELGFSAPTAEVAFVSPIYEDFLSQVESGTYVADKK